MGRRSAVRRAPAVLAGIGLLVAACAPVTAPAPVLAPERTVTRQTKLAWVIRLEQERRLRETGEPAAWPPATGAPPFRAATMPALDLLSRDPDPVVRRRAVLAMGRVGTVEGLPYATAALADTEEAVRVSAAVSLGLYGPAAKVAVGALETALRDPSMLVRTRAVEALGLIGQPSAVAAIYQAATDCRARLGAIEPDREEPQAPEVELCRAALFAFVQLQSYDAIAGLTLDADGQPATRWWPAAFALQRINDRRAVPALLALASVPSIYTPGFALRGLASLRESALVPIASTWAADQHADIKLRVAAVRALGAMGGAEGGAPLLRLLDRPPLPRVLVLEVLAGLGASRHAPAFEWVLDYVTEPDPAVRAAALTAAATIAPDSFLVVLAGLGRDADWSVRAALARTLATLPAERVLAAAVELAADDDPRVRVPALETLAILKAPDLKERVFSALEAADFAERAAAARLIGAHRFDGAVARLQTAYERGQSDAAYDARAAALAALAAFGGEDVRTILRRGLGDRDWAVRSRTAQLLQGLGDTSAAPERPAPLHMSTDEFESEPFQRPMYSPQAYIETRLGTIQIELDVVDAAVTSWNFVSLARRGFFDGMKMHRVVPGFVVQAGDPRGDGSGGPGYTIRDELNVTPFVRGTVGMALAWPDSGGSQFFVTLSPQPHLNGRYTAFGRVVDGEDVLDQLAPWDVIDRVRIWDGVAFR